MNQRDVGRRGGIMKAKPAASATSNAATDVSMAHQRGAVAWRRRRRQAWQAHRTSSRQRSDVRHGDISVSTRRRHRQRDMAHRIELATAGGVA